MKLKLTVVFISLMCSSFVLDAQMHFGIRAGLNYSKFLGPSETDVKDDFTLGGGFHFGLNFLYDVSQFVSIGTELTYVQNGSGQNYSGDSFYIFNTTNEPRYVVRDSSRINMKFSNAYLHIPLTVNIRTLEKLEFYGGAYFNILISPTATGNWSFGTEGTAPQDSIRRLHSFNQGQDHRYNSDLIGGFNGNGGYTTVYVNDELLTSNVFTGQIPRAIPRLAGGYYLYEGATFTEKPGNRFAGLDYGLIAGFNYFINRGLYAGIRFEYGFKDLTINAQDYSYKEVNDDGSLIFRDDRDTHFGINISMGFRF